MTLYLIIAPTLLTYDQAKKNWDTRLGAAAPGELPYRYGKGDINTSLVAFRLYINSMLKLFVYGCLFPGCVVA